MTNISKEKIFIYGASGHAKVVIDIIEQEGRYIIEFLVDDAPDHMGAQVCGYEVIGDNEDLLRMYVGRSPSAGIVAIGDNQTRLRIGKWLESKSFGLINAIHPASHRGKNVKIENGTVVMAGAVINTDTIIGKHVIVNTNVSIDHDCSISNGVHVAPGSTICGSVSVGEATLIGANATVVPNVTIDRDVTVGAGSTVLHDVPAGATIVGIEMKTV